MHVMQKAIGWNKSFLKKFDVADTDNQYTEDGELEMELPERVHPAPDFELDSEEIVESDDVLD